MLQILETNLDRRAHLPVTKKPVEIAGLRWPPEIPAVAYKRTANTKPLPRAAVGRPVLTEFASQAPPKNAKKNAPRNSANTQQVGMPQKVRVTES